jgi:hypothetical protein
VWVISQTNRLRNRRRAIDQTQCWRATLTRSISARHALGAAMRAPNVSSPSGDETKLRWDETVFRPGEDIRKPALDTNRSSTKGRKGP